ncbi:MAG TPA: hypothetical protein PLC34_14770, partial [Burkholderiaceae bacterium]|nr:hypothetical protein [Burkholderiaceae bacterium]
QVLSRSSSCADTLLAKHEVLRQTWVLHMLRFVQRPQVTLVALNGFRVGGFAKIRGDAPASLLDQLAPGQVVALKSVPARLA